MTIPATATDNRNKTILYKFVRLTGQTGCMIERRLTRLPIFILLNIDERDQIIRTAFCDILCDGPHRPNRLNGFFSEITPELNAALTRLICASNSFRDVLSSGSREDYFTMKSIILSCIPSSKTRSASMALVLIEALILGTPFATLTGTIRIASPPAGLVAGHLLTVAGGLLAGGLVIGGLVSSLE